MQLGGLLPYVLAMAGLGFVLLLLVAVLSPRKGAKKKGQHAYRIDGPLLSKAERSFYGVLLQALEGQDSTAFAKVRVADVLKPAKSSGRSAWQSAFNAISSKHFDFVVCSSASSSVQLVIELDDASHDSKDRARRDAFLEAACESAGLPLLRFRAARSYVVSDVRTKLGQVLRLEPTVDAPATGAPADGVSPPKNGRSAPIVPPPTNRPDSTDKPVTLGADAAVGAEVAIDAPACPKCGAAMRIMQPATGTLAGQTFWACSTYPACKGAKHLAKGKAQHEAVNG